MRWVALLTLMVISTYSRAAESRTVAEVARAIGHFRPSAPLAERRAWAKQVIGVANRHAFDPLTAIALCGHESGLRPTAVSPDGEDVGLCQIRARYVGACAADADPVRNPSAGCRAVKARLMTVTGGLEQLGHAITSWRRTCRQITGRAPMLHHILHGYGGMGSPKAGRVCGQSRTRKGWVDLPIPRPIRDIMACRKSLSAGRACSWATRSPPPRRAATRTRSASRSRSAPKRSAKR